MKQWFLIPLAAVAGLLVGSWGPRAELRARDQQAAEEKAKPQQNANGFSSFAQMVNIPDKARRPRRNDGQSRLKKPGSTNVIEVAEAPVTNAAPEQAVVQQEKRPPAPPPSPEDLRARIEEAQEMWRTRVDVARAQWKERLKLDDVSAQKFDAALDEMNIQLYDTMQALAEQIASKKKLTQELGLRLVGDATTIMAETYDKLGAVVPEAGRGSVSDIQMTDFIDPGVAEPLIAVQGSLENVRLPIGRMGRR